MDRASELRLYPYSSVRVRILPKTFFMKNIFLYFLILTNLFNVFAGTTSSFLQSDDLNKNTLTIYKSNRQAMNRNSTDTMCCMMDGDPWSVKQHH